MQNEKPAKIESFDGDYRFLSNFYGVPVTFNGLTYGNAEAAYQAQKQPERAAEFVGINPAHAKSLGRKLTMRPDWDAVKWQVMLDLTRAKYAQSNYLRKKLLETGHAEIIEGNYWGDTYWGVCRGKGRNELGKILMQVRDELRRAQ